MHYWLRQTVKGLHWASDAGDIELADMLSSVAMYTERSDMLSNVAIILRSTLHNNFLNEFRVGRLTGSSNNVGLALARSRSV